MQSPARALKNPVLTGATGHLNWQPWLTVQHDPALPAQRRFRVWYDADADLDPAEGKFATRLGYLESADGVAWPGKPRFLDRVDGIVFGASVLDDGPKAPRAEERYKLMFWRKSGPAVAFSAEGLHWNMHNGGRAILPASAGGDSWHAGYDPLRRRYFLFGKSNEIHHWTNAEGQSLAKRLRLFSSSTSEDFKTWSPLKMQFAPDHRDPGITEGYAVTGFQTRGELLFGFFQVLRDDLSPAGAPPEAMAANPTRAAGMGHTVLCWTRDGETWQRDLQADAFLTPDAEVGSWDHAMAWVSSVVPVGDEVLVYYAGYRWGHKYRRSEDRQVGLVKLRHDRYVARQAGHQAGTLVTRPLLLDCTRLMLNIDAAQGEARVQVCGPDGKPLAGFAFADARPVNQDSLAVELMWKRPLGELRGQTVQLEISLRNARLFALEAR